MVPCSHSHAICVTRQFSALATSKEDSGVSQHGAIHRVLMTNPVAEPKQESNWFHVLDLLTQILPQA